MFSVRHFYHCTFFSMVTQLGRVKLKQHSAEAQDSSFFPLFFQWPLIGSYSSGIPSSGGNPSGTGYTTASCNPLINPQQKLGPEYNCCWFIELKAVFGVCRDAGCCSTPQLCGQQERSQAPGFFKPGWERFGSSLFLPTKSSKHLLLLDFFFLLKYVSEIIKRAFHVVGWAKEALKVKPRTA